MPKVFLGMSGGVDSSVSAILLKKQGYDITGIYMKNWSEDLPGMKCPWAEDLADAKRVAVMLDIDFEVWDFEVDYKAKVVDYMLTEFKKGRTPNPDVMCNEQIKFKLFYDRALERGADFIATGHYARVEHNATCQERLKRAKAERAEGEPRKDGRATGSLATSGIMLRSPVLCRAADENKDQTYFLYRMSDAATAKTLFPIGHLTKPEVKDLAKHHNLDVATKKESMGVCFVGEVGMKDFLREYLDATPGEIREIETEKVLGFHDGAIFYTIGQRHGLHLGGGGLPYYVIKKDLSQNIVYVSRNLNHENLWTSTLKLENIHLRNDLTINELAKIPNLQVRLRHRAPLIDVGVKATSLSRGAETKVLTEVADKAEGRRSSEEVFATNGERAKRGAPVTTGRDEAASEKNDGLQLHFVTSIKRPAPGQSAVLYSGEICLGGGIIAE